MAHEIEAKLRITQTDLPVVALQAELKRMFAVSAMQERCLRNIYFDTPDLALHAQRVALRLRHQAHVDRWVQTFKTQGEVVAGVHRRGEWEWPVPDAMLDQSGLSQLQQWPAAVSVASLVPVFETNFTRYQAELDYEGARIELVIDSGAIIAGSAREAIYEIELELLAGEESALLALSEQLRRECEYVALYDRSKAERGYALFTGKAKTSDAPDGGASQ